MLIAPAGAVIGFSSAYWKQRTCKDTNMLYGKTSPADEGRASLAASQVWLRRQASERGYPDGDEVRYPDGDE